MFLSTAIEAELLLVAIISGLPSPSRSAVFSMEGYTLEIVVWLTNEMFPGELLF